MTRRPRVLSIAGSDSGGGAGIQADLKTFSALGVYGATVVTAVTAQNTLGVSSVHEVPPDVVAAQLEAVLGDIGVDAIKIGMLASVPLIRTVADGLEAAAGVPVVLDPVMVAQSGDALLRDDAVEALADLVLPRATVVTPNLPEAARLTGLPINSPEERRQAAAALADRGRAVLLKGGHGTGKELVDLLLFEGEEYLYRHVRQETTSTHGTGCTLSAAIAAELGAGRTVVEAVERGIEYLQGAIASAFPLGAGHGPVDHLYRSMPAGDSWA